MFEKLTDPKDIILQEGQVPIRHRYTPGLAGEAFFVGMKERGELVASRCPECGIVYCPPRLYCERDFAEMEADTTVGPGGVLESFTVGFSGVNGEPVEAPIAIGLVRPDGADTVLMHFIVEADELEIGQRMEAVFLPDAERSGGILDLRGFRPVAG